MFDEIKYWYTRNKYYLIAISPLLFALLIVLFEPNEAKANPTDQNMTRIVAAEERQVKVLEEIAQLLRKGCRCK